jgi:hypothetical protein
MSVDLDLETRRGDAQPAVDISRDPAAILAALAYRPRLALELRQDPVEVDPLAGEDELWADEDFLRTPDAENYVGFLRRLWLAIFACGLFWIMVVLGGLGLSGVLA